MNKLSDIGKEKHDTRQHEQAVFIFNKVLRIKVKTDTGLVILIVLT